MLYLLYLLYYRRKCFYISQESLWRYSCKMYGQRLFIKECRTNSSFAENEKFRDTKKGVDQVMGGKVLELETDKFIKKIRDKYKDELEAEAKDEVKTEVAIRMLKRGNCSLEEIANDTQLSLEQIKKIKEELQL